MSDSLKTHKRDKSTDYSSGSFFGSPDPAKCIASPPPFNPHAGVAQRAEEEKEKEGEEEGKDPESVAGQIVDCLHPKRQYGVVMRVPQLVAPLMSGLSPDEAALVYHSYLNKTGRLLEADLKMYCSESHYRQAVAKIWHLIPVERKLMLAAMPGLGGINTGAVVEVIRTASGEDLAQIKSNPQMLEGLKNGLDHREMYEVNTLLFPERKYENVKELIRGSDTFLNDKEAIYQGILDLSVAERRQLWNEDRSLFSYLSSYSDDDSKIVPGSHFFNIRMMCLGNEAQALYTGMHAATDGLGTYDDLAKTVVTKTGEAKKQQEALKGAQGSGNPETAQSVQNGLDDLGPIDQLLNGEGEAGENFLGNLRGDVSQEEFDSYLQQMQVDSYEQVRQMILGAPGVFGGDKQRVFSALDKLSNPADRLKLTQDSEIMAAVGLSVGEKDYDRLLAYLDGDTYALARHKLLEAATFVNQDESQIIKVLTEASPEDRERLKKESGDVLQLIEYRLNERGRKMLYEVLENGQLSTKTSVDWALGGNFDGTAEEFINETFDRMDQAERLKFRMGYAAMKGYQLPAPLLANMDMEAAKRDFFSLYVRLSGEMNQKELDDALDHLLGGPTLAELSQPEVFMDMMAHIDHSRTDDKSKVRDGSVGDEIMDVFSNKGGEADIAEISARSKYGEYKSISPEDQVGKAKSFMELSALNQEFDSKIEEYRAQSEAVAEIAGMVAAIAVGIAVTVATGGPGGVAAGNILASKLGTIGSLLLTATSAGLAKAGTEEAILGNDSDFYGTDGAQSFVEGGADGLITFLTAGIGSRLVGEFGNLVGLEGPALTAQLQMTTLRTTEVSLSGIGKRFSAGFLSGSIEGALGGAAMDVTMTAMDAETWSQSIWDTVNEMGWSMLRGGALGFGVGGVVGGAMEVGGYGLNGSKGGKNKKGYNNEPENLQKEEIRDDIGEEQNLELPIPRESNPIEWDKIPLVVKESDEFKGLSRKNRFRLEKEMQAEPEFKAALEQNPKLISAWKNVVHLWEFRNKPGYLRSVYHVWNNEKMLHHMFFGDYFISSSGPHAGSPRGTGMHHHTGERAGRNRINHESKKYGIQYPKTYTAGVEVRNSDTGGWLPKSNNGGESSFFPEHWSKQQTKEEVAYAHWRILEDKGASHVQGNEYGWISSKGEAKIHMYLRSNDEIISPFPVVN